MNLIEIKELLSENSGTLLAIVLIIMTLIEVTPIKVNPWSAIKRLIGKIFGWIGNTLNGAVLIKLDELEKSQQEMQVRLDEHIRTDDERDMDGRRQSILEFNAELIQKKNFTFEHFNNVLDEIGKYERYCDDHPDYKNKKAVMAIANIKRVYEEHEREGDFAI